MKSSIIAGFLATIPEENARFTDKNLDISEQVYALLEKKGLSQKEFAQLLGKNESEVSKWLSGLHNLTLKSIARMEAALGEDIIITPQQTQAKYARTKVEIDNSKLFAVTKPQTKPDNESNYALAA